ncbi:Methylenetetrahydrofolate--tRNA-(uracil-5-)- methyltransferase TrmFO [Luteitalea pratensis]|uniref:Methylenetetrahydrofolate--tRNA-(uracil-5-)-methyltransferase TrmFO n=1 Tax=Luteitalea pratensis TaxID=1855912 RepID=A0A143PWL8_LUTPR|nr:Methylenetetrahydrofolate--tRNA-(uracil-5-)- methyltransferase TrmFO [Luteitalea pratensis]
MVTIIGGGLAGCEAAWQVASRGVRVRLHEMRPVRPTLVHQGDRLAELVCSNSFRGDKLDNAVGVLKEEMRRLGSIIMRCAEATRVPAGAALAVDRGRFADAVTAAICAHPLIEVVREEITAIPAAGATGGPVIVATGPLTSDTLSQDIARFVGAEHLSFYDAISPIVLAESIDRSIVFRASRWGRSLRGDERRASSTPTRVGSESAHLEGTGVAELARQADSTAESGSLQAAGCSLPEAEPEAEGPACGVDDGEGDYLNCPMDEAEYRAFYDALVSAESATVHDFDSVQFFEGCLPIEVMAHRGRETLRFGPMKPVGLPDPRTGRIPFAVVQLRQDTLAGDHFSLVGFQTQLKWGDQARVLRMIPGLQDAEFVRFGMVHRNTYINGPMVLLPTWQTRAREDLFFAGQVSGVEGYVESAGSGLLAGINAAHQALALSPIEAPRETAIGALAYYVSHAEARHYQPTNITFGIMPPLELPAARRSRGEGGPRRKDQRKEALAQRALQALDNWMGQVAIGAPA